MKEIDELTKVYGLINNYYSTYEGFVSGKVITAKVVLEEYIGNDKYKLLDIKALIEADEKNESNIISSLSVLIGILAVGISLNTQLDMVDKFLIFFVTLMTVYLIYKICFDKKRKWRYYLKIVLEDMNIE